MMADFQNQNNGQACKKSEKKNQFPSEDTLTIRSRLRCDSDNGKV
jgi:hypothetical protein